MRDDFAAFILSYKRPDRVITYNTLRRQGYTGQIVIVVSDDDPTLPEYQRRFGSQVVVFNKQEVAKRIDVGDNFGKWAAVVFARNAAFDIAQQLGIRYFLQLDDDYRYFAYRYYDSYTHYERQCRNLDRLFDITLEFFKSLPPYVVTVAFAQTGDYIGGRYGTFARSVLKRKAMNTFFCDVERRFPFIGFLNEDVNTYCRWGFTGLVFFTLTNVVIKQATIHGENPGGLSEAYRGLGTYVKSFYPVMYCPSFVRLGIIGTKNRRVHHIVSWQNAVPKIISERYRK